ncbi:MAG: peptidoglycan-binding protein, partial [Clostridia bacterium]|nr:peptidoglycan-binding protein [Clostridia bacterium]
MNTIRKGSKGDDVRKLQELLGITADGFFGPITKAAVVAYQSVNGLKADGIV